MQTNKNNFPLNTLRNLGVFAPWRFTRNVRLDSVAFWLSLAAVWISAHPYLGIWHDGQLYALQAFHRLFPGQFDQDLFLAFGSQDNYTCFPTLYAALISCFGLNYATILLLWSGYLMWALALIILARTLCSGPSLWLFLLLGFGLHGSYADFTFGYAENYLTPRIFAEALVLFSMAALVRRNYPALLSLLVLAAPLHPLIAMTGLLYAFFYLTLENPRRIWLGGVGAVAILVLAGTGIRPFDSLLQRVDAEWYSILYESNRFLFVTRWELEHLNLFLSDLGALILAVLCIRGAPRKLLLAVLLASVAGVCMSLIGSDGLGNLLLMQLQFLRTLWLAHLLAYFAIAWTMARLLRGERSSSLLFALCWIAGARLCLESPASAVLSLGACLILLLPQRVDRAVAGRKLLQAVMLAPFVAAALSWTVNFYSDSWLAVAERISVHIQDPPWLFVLYGVILPVCLGWTALICYRMCRRSDRLALVAPGSRPACRLGLTTACVSLLLMAASLLMWDQRDSNTLRVESYTFQDSARSTLPKLRRDATIFWDDDHINEIWFSFGRPSYASWQQGAGMVFFRQTAMEWQRRVAHLHLLGVEESTEEKTLRRTRLPSPQELSLACRDPILDYLVLDRRLDGSRHFSLQDRDFFLYDCLKLRDSSRPGTLAVSQNEPGLNIRK